VAVVQESLRVSGMYRASRKQDTALSLLAKACLFAYITAPGPGIPPCSMQKCYFTCSFAITRVAPFQSIKVGDIHLSILMHGAMAPATLCLGGLGHGSRKSKFSPASTKFKIYCGSEFDSPSTTTLVESNLVDMDAFLV